MAEKLGKTNAVKSQSKKGFTLVELVVVIAILAILAAIAIPTIYNVTNAAIRSTALTNAHSLDSAIKQAQTDIATNTKTTYSFDYSASPPKIVTFKEVCKKMSITDAVEKVNYYRQDYSFYWDSYSGGVVVAKSATEGKDIDGNTINNGGSGTMTALCDGDAPSELFGSGSYKGDVSTITLK